MGTARARAHRDIALRLGKNPEALGRTHEAVAAKRFSGDALTDAASGMLAAGAKWPLVRQRTASARLRSLSIARGYEAS
jgi:hypothetical protein